MRTWAALEIPQDDDLVHAFLIDFNLIAIHDARFFFNNGDDRDRAAAALRAHFPHIDARPIDVPDEDCILANPAEREIFEKQHPPKVPAKK